MRTGPIVPGTRFGLVGSSQGYFLSSMFMGWFILKPCSGEGSLSSYLGRASIEIFFKKPYALPLLWVVLLVELGTITLLPIYF